MIDRIIGWDNGNAIYNSDLDIYGNYIGYEDENGEVHLYVDDVEDVSYYEW